MEVRNFPSLNPRVKPQKENSGTSGPEAAKEPNCGFRCLVAFPRPSKKLSANEPLSAR